MPHHWKHRGFEQPGLVKDVPPHGRGVGLDDLQRSLPTQTLCDSMVCMHADTPTKVYLYRNMLRVRMELTRMCAHMGVCPQTHHWEGERVWPCFPPRGVHMAPALQCGVPWPPVPSPHPLLLWDPHAGSRPGPDKSPTSPETAAHRP